MTGQIVAVVVGVVGILWLVLSAARTVVMPRPERVWLTVTMFEIARRLSRALAGRFRDPQHKARVLGAFAPVVLVTLPLIWSVGLIIFFAAIYWGISDLTIPEAIELSGSSLTTLGFTQAPNTFTRILAISEALVGLTLVALMIGFLPTLYGAFSRREVAVGRLTTRAGAPPDPVHFLVRLHLIGRLDRIGDRWDEWEDWFVELGETHTTFPPLIYFRSAHPEKNWLGAAESALDTAAIVRATQLVSQTGQADTMIRSGFIALRGIADFYQIQPELDPAQKENISVDRQQFETLMDALEQQGLTSAVPRSEAWDAFAGWRVNYDRALVGLRSLVGQVPSHWDLHHTWQTDA